MAQRAYSFFAFLLIFNILLATTWQANAGRTIASDDKKEPEFLFKHEFGKKFHFGFPPKFRLTPSNPYVGGIGGGGSGSEAGSGYTGRSYVPGNDDTFVPNPGYEVPIPGGGGRVASSVNP
ncbi:hypothetical protein TSUD_271670 [Trifolium subterraneum]|uniref:Cell wall protein n=1 Tax=Trifolium subterraneum TaxID=3900 RepID=A0A2Z6NA04_TRISU|nr:hypothetical protein TSUD_271670 [Trifolium subterraneum]